MKNETEITLQPNEVKVIREIKSSDYADSNTEECMIYT